MNSWRVCFPDTPHAGSGRLFCATEASLLPFVKWTVSRGLTAQGCGQPFRVAQ
jgi:hypothetical protein